MSHEIAFEMVASNVRFGAGVTREVGMDLYRIAILGSPLAASPAGEASVSRVESDQRCVVFPGYAYGRAISGARGPHQIEIQTTPDGIH
jgi:hypothetical protein